MMGGMDQRSDRDSRSNRSNKDVLVLLAVIAAIVVLAVLLTWTASDEPEAPLDTDPHTSPAPTSAP